MTTTTTTTTTIVSGSSKEGDYWQAVNSCSVWPYDPLFRSPLESLPPDPVHEVSLERMLEELEKMRDIAYFERSVSDFQASRAPSAGGSPLRCNSEPSTPPPAPRTITVLSVSPDTPESPKKRPLRKGKNTLKGRKKAATTDAGIEPATSSAREVSVLSEPLCEPPPARKSAPPPDLEFHGDVLQEVIARSSGTSDGTMKAVGLEGSTSVGEATVTSSVTGAPKRKRGRKPRVVDQVEIVRNETEQEKEERMKKRDEDINKAINDTRNEILKQKGRASKWSCPVKGKDDTSGVTEESGNSALRLCSPTGSMVSSEKSMKAPTVSDKIKNLGSQIANLIHSIKAAGSSSNDDAVTSDVKSTATTERRGVKREAASGKGPPPAKRSKPSVQRDRDNAPGPSEASSTLPQQQPLDVNSPVSSIVTSSPLSTGSALDDLYSALSREMGVEEE
ncbi:hypothetical protein FOL47_009951 [Perkinsus chesapeaki]|uniref:Uncharacterized protein n=1 Tax=Perkinsus chesapeaki TaxID=330153 RepID=A0A7J6MRR0_PERCH|nr:hypothetical protein FOL47_009951 [Perkinsus chesapeaki]